MLQNYFYQKSLKILLVLSAQVTFKQNFPNWALMEYLQIERLMTFICSASLHVQI